MNRNQQCYPSVVPQNRRIVSGVLISRIKGCFDVTYSKSLLKSPILQAVMLGWMIGLSGCSEETMINARDKAYARIRGDLMGDVADKLDAVYTASLDAARHLDHYEIVGTKLTAINGQITMFDRDAERTMVILSKTEDNTTRIQIRIGAFGDKIKAVYLYDAIRNRLNKTKLAMAPF